MRLAFALLVLFTMSGCPGAADKKAPPSDGKCASFGDTCTIAPGKLGACVVRDGCTGEGCLVCQSQH